MAIKNYEDGEMPPEDVVLKSYPRCNCKLLIHPEHMLGAECRRCKTVVKLSISTDQPIDKLPLSFFQTKENTMSNQQNSQKAQDQQNAQHAQQQENWDDPIQADEGEPVKPQQLIFGGMPEGWSPMKNALHPQSQPLLNANLDHGRVVGNRTPRYLRAGFDQQMIRKNAEEMAAKQKKFCLNITTVETFFADYNYDLRKAVSHPDGDNENESFAVMSVMLALRELRELIIRQHEYRHRMNQGPEDVFFSQKIMPALIPTYDEGFDAVHVIMLNDYFQRLQANYPDFQSSMIAIIQKASTLQAEVFSENIGIAMGKTSTDHFVLLPTPANLLKNVIEHKEKLDQKFGKQ